MQPFYQKRFFHFCSWNAGLLFYFIIALLITDLAHANTSKDDIPTPSVSDVARCGPGNVTFVATGCTAGYTPKWYDSSSLNNEMSSGITFTTPVLNSTTNYFLLCVDDADTSLKSPAVKATAVVNPELIVTLSGRDSLCDNSSLGFLGSPAGGSFSLPDGPTSDFFSISRFSSGDYLVLIAGSGVPNITVNYTYTDPTTGCSAMATKTVTTYPAPKPSVNSPTICEGETATLTVENCTGSLQWYDGVINNTSKSIQVSPTVTTEYRASCSMGGCDSLTIAKVTVIQKPDAFISGPDTLCASRLPFTYTGTPSGGSFVLPKGLPAGAATVSGNLLTINPGYDIVNTSFSYQNTESTYGCTATAMKYITITPPLEPTITESLTLCAGAVTNLQIENCPGKIRWSSNDFQPIDNKTLPIITVSPTVTTDYSVRCTVGGCDTTLTTRVIVDKVQPTLSYFDSYCSEDKKTTGLTIVTSDDATLTTNIGTLDGSKLYNIPDYETLIISSSLNGCTAKISLTFHCDSSSIPKCLNNRIDTISAVAATCSGNVISNNALILIDGVYADRYTYGSTFDGLLPYSQASEVLDYRIEITDLPNPASPVGQIYFVRAYYGGDSCSFDTTVVVPYRDCSIPCVKPYAGEDMFARSYTDTYESDFRLPQAGPLQKWIAAATNPSGTINAATGHVQGVLKNGKYTFILTDGGPGECTDTMVVYRGSQELATIVTYSDTITLPRYLINQYDDGSYINNYGVWSTLPGNSATLTNYGLASGLTTPGMYKFVLKAPYNVNYQNWQDQTLTLTFIKLAKPDNCLPQLCVPFSLKRMKIAAR